MGDLSLANLAYTAGMTLHSAMQEGLSLMHDGPSASHPMHILSNQKAEMLKR